MAGLNLGDCLLCRATGRGSTCGPLLGLKGPQALQPWEHRLLHRLPDCRTQRLAAFWHLCSAAGCLFMQPVFACSSCRVARCGRASAPQRT